MNYFVFPFLFLLTVLWFAYSVYNVTFSWAEQFTVIWAIDKTLQLTGILILVTSFGFLLKK